MAREDKRVLVGLKLGFHSSISNAERRILWRDLSTIASSISGPWAIGSDFNVVLSITERRGSRNYDQDSTSEFAEAMNNAALLDAGYSGNNYTWCNNQAGNACQLKAAKDNLSTLECQAQDGSVQITPSSLFNARRHLASMELIEDIYWKQKARNNWLLEGDRNTRFFHLQAMERSKRAGIDHQAHSDHLLDGIPQLLTATDNAFLMHILSMIEVKDAVMSIPKDGVPGPNGFLGAFFAGSWDIVGFDILKAITRLFQGGTLPRVFTTTLICLIPKVTPPKKFSNFWPISLYNFVYKIFTKVIASRLALLLLKLISQEQGAFVRGRSIAESIALGQEIFRDIGHKVHGGNIILKLDMEKSYDRIEWGFLNNVLNRFSFNTAWIRMVEKCWNNVWFTVLINGEGVGFSNRQEGCERGTQYPLASLF
ncbi:uncharacterized protein LOC131226815 [Magnolia sinica]|uniref:uncharacterized protein LOC131226815 n=1 Tax=Magnolia sinica TaxID=86752 RepID=UPI0026595D90|nr:uncharacterized protein LOC131226815 [Magnolia sinica]